MSDTAPAEEADELIAELRETEARLRETEARVEEFGREELERLRNAYDEFVGLLDRYEDQVVGDAGDIKTNVEFQSQVARVVNDIPPNVLLYETFVEAADFLKQKYFNQSDFEHVREQLEPVGDIVVRLEDDEQTRQEYRALRRDIRGAIRGRKKRIEELERLVELGEADLDAPTDRLREPIEAYNETAAAAFRSFVETRPAREVLDVLATTEWYPLVPFEPPPADLVAYLETAAVGELSVPKLLEYARYSRSKLDHYVADPDRFARLVGGRKTFLSRLDPDPLQVAWPPPPAARLRWRCSELTAVLDRIEPDAVADLRAVAALPRETDYERLRTSAVAREQLTDAERERLRSGDVTATLASLREQRDRLQAALDESRAP